MATSGTVEGTGAKLNGYNFFYARGKGSITENTSSITVKMDVYVVMASSASEAGYNFKFSYAFMDGESWSSGTTSNNSNYFNTATQYKIGSVSKTYNKGTSTQTIHPWIRIQDTYTGNPNTSTSSSSYSGTYTIPTLAAGTPTNPTVSTYNSITKIKIGSTTYDIRDAKLRISSATPYTKIKEYSTGITQNTNATGLANIVKYSLFGLVMGLSASSNLGIFLIGTWYFNNYTKGTGKTNAEIHGCASYDDGSSYVLKGSLKCTSTNGTCLYRGSSHILGSSGNSGSAGYLKQVWGLF